MQSPAGLFQDIESVLKEELGEEGLSYLLPQINLTKQTRNLPKNLIDERMISSKFLIALQVIENWIAPIAEILRSFETDEAELRSLQEEARYLLQKSKITSWQQAMGNPELQLIFNKLQTLRLRLETERNQSFLFARRQKISDLLGLILYPYSGHKTLPDAIRHAEKKYFGPNVNYRKTNKYTDAMILMKAAQEVYEQKDLTIDPANEQEVISYEVYFKDTDPTVQAVYYTYLEAKKGNFHDSGFTMREINTMISKVLKRTSGMTPAERTMFSSEPFYLQSVDLIRADLIMQWLEGQSKGTTKTPGMLKSAKFTSAREKKDKTEKRYLFGLSFLDKHVNNDILGNIPETSFIAMERVLGPFVELKQYVINMESAQFEINAPGVPDQAWIYDFTAVKTEILRSTMLLISEKQPKFDLLESCQQLVNAVLSGRVDRNDLRKENNYVYTNLLPKPTWDYIGSTLMQILKEALIDEDTHARFVVRKIFSEEDRSHLVSSKRFVPVFYLEYTWQFQETKEQNPPAVESVSIWKARSFDFQYRYLQASGYPWYFKENSTLAELVVDSLKLTRLTFREVNMRRLIYTIDGRKIIIYFQTSTDLTKMQVLAFREVGEFEEGISPVEVLFRPKKYIDKTPEQNNLLFLVKDARATDPKDLETLISSLDQGNQ
ncbi:MAG TPA: hypothetical protein VJ044_13505 [Candidatus Hodarchaeales archaeon]|nr:hypothetical protein [Candidatus Hodarchaeales archaeon]